MNCKINFRNTYLFVLVILSIIGKANLCFGIQLPDQKFTVALPVTSFSKTSAHPSGANSGSLPVGFGAEYSIFLTKTMSLDGQFVVNLESTEQSIVFMGGSGGTKWYLLGGSNEENVDPYLSFIGSSNIHAFVLVAFAARQFDFTVLEKDLALQRDKQNPISGSVFALQLGTGVEYSVFNDFLIGTRLQYLSSFSNPNSPELSIVEFWLTTSYLL